MPYYLAFDPGNTTGYAEFDVHGEISDFGQINNGVEGITDFVMQYDKPIHTVIIESYMVLPDDHSVKANVGSKLETVQVIGVLRGWAYSKKAKIVMQQPQIKKIAELQAGFKVKGKHENTHWQDAVLHGVYYLVKNKIRKPKGLEGKEFV